MENFFENNYCGFLITTIDGLIVKCNKMVAEWTGIEHPALTGKHVQDLLTVGSRIFYETHLSPLLRMQKFIEEVQLDIRHQSGEKLPMLVNATVEDNQQTELQPLVYYTLIRYKDRFTYEQNLRNDVKDSQDRLELEKNNVILREQLIAVLGHDLRNPLSSIMMAANLLETAEEKEKENLLYMLKRSSYRMQELIANIMDFARTRLGASIVLNRQEVLLVPIIEHVVNEQRYVYPARKIVTHLTIDQPLHCDADRISQLLSNLIANALQHGEPEKPVTIDASVINNTLHISVINAGQPIQLSLQPHLFEPFTKEADRSSKNGLGLGLHIASQIAKAHGGSLDFTSDINKTCFTFSMSL